MQDAGGRPRLPSRLFANWRRRAAVAVGPCGHRDVGGRLPPLDAAGIVVMAPAASALHLSGRDDHLFRGNWTTRENGSNYARHYFDAGIRRCRLSSIRTTAPLLTAGSLEFTRSARGTGRQSAGPWRNFSSVTPIWRACCKAAGTKPAALVLTATSARMLACLAQR